MIAYNDGLGFPSIDLLTANKLTKDDIFRAEVDHLKRINLTKGKDGDSVFWTHGKDAFKLRDLFSDLFHMDSL